jgi:hypothetical protein
MWLIIGLIGSSVPYLIYLPFWSSLNELLQTDYDRAQTIISVTNEILRVWRVISMGLQLILICLICRAISGNGRKIVRNLFTTVKRNWGSFLMFFAVVIAFSSLMTALPIYVWRLNLAFPIREVTDILRNAALLFQVTSISVVCFGCLRPVVIPKDENTEEAHNMGDTLRYRIEPSLSFADAGEFHCGLARVRQPHLLGKGSWGYADTNGQIVIDFAYKEAGDFHEGIAIVKDGKCEYFIDTAGKMAIPVEYQQASRFQDGLAVVKMDFNWFAIERDGEAKLLPYDDVFSFSEGFAVVRDGKKWMYINRELKPVISTEYNDVWSFYDRLAMVERDGMVGYIDANGLLVIPPRYINAQSFSEGLAAVTLVADGKWGYIDRNGREAIPAVFDGAGSFRQGRAAVCADGKYGHIDTEGTFITPAEYDSAGAFSDGFAVVVATAQDLTPDGTNRPLSFLGQNFTLAGEATYGYVDLDGNECTSLMYQEARPFSEGLAWVKMDSGWGILEIVSG